MNNRKKDHVLELLKHPCDINLWDDCRRTALYYASFLWLSCFLEMLQVQNALVIYEDNMPFQTLLHGMMEEGVSSAIVSILIIKIIQSKEFKPAVYKAMVMAANNKRTDIVRIFLQNNVSVNSMNCKKETALMEAISSNNCHTTKFLLENQAVPNVLGFYSQ